MTHEEQAALAALRAGLYLHKLHGGQILGESYLICGDRCHEVGTIIHPDPITALATAAEALGLVPEPLPLQSDEPIVMRSRPSAEYDVLVEISGVERPPMRYHTEGDADSPPPPQGARVEAVMNVVDDAAKQVHHLYGLNPRSSVAAELAHWNEQLIAALQQPPQAPVPMDAVETLAAHCHDQQWSGWMRYLFSKCMSNSDGTMTIPQWAVERWKRQAATAYGDLPEQERESDREEARGILAALQATPQDRPPVVEVPKGD